ncbi:hypothetical protein Bca4012_049944 [Brassica carinata]
MLDIGGDSLALEFKHRGMARFLAGIRLLGCGDVGSTPLFGGCGNAVTSSEMAVGFGVWFSGTLRCRGDVLHISFKPGELRRLVVTEVFLFGCFTIDTSGLLNESRASDTLVLEVDKRRTDYVLVMTVSLLSYVSHPSTDGFGVKIRPALATKARVYNLAIRYLVSVFAVPLFQSSGASVLGTITSLDKFIGS